jgi:protein SCO1/2
VPRYRVLGLLGLSFVAMGAGLAVGLWSSDSGDLPEINGFLYPQAKAIAPFELAGQNGASVGPSDFKGKWSFVFFGYTHCPDVCPTTLANLSRAQQLLEAADLDADNQYVFVSVDPKRDTPERLASYVVHFNQRFIGVTASERMLERFTHEVGVLYEYPQGTEGDGYAVSHSSALALFDPNGRLHAVFTAPHRPEAIADDFRKIYRRWEGGASAS